MNDRKGGMKMTDFGRKHWVRGQKGGRKRRNGAERGVRNLI